MALGRVVRTTAFKLSVIYLGLFSIFAAAFFVYVSFAIDRLLIDCAERVHEHFAATLQLDPEQALT